MRRSLEDIRDNIDHVGCDNQTALEMCAEIGRLRQIVRVNGLRWGHTHAEIDALLSNGDRAE